MRGTVFKTQPGEQLARAGVAIVGRTSDRTMTLRFSQTVVGRPEDDRLHRRGDEARLHARVVRRHGARSAQDRHLPAPRKLLGKPREGETPASRACSMALMSRLPLVAVAGAACAALALPAYASAEIIEIGKVDPPPVAELPDAPLPRRQPHDRLPGQDRPDARRDDDPQGRQHRRLDDRARQAGQEADDVLQRQAGRRVPGAAHDPQPAQQAALARRRPGRRRRSSRPTSARTVQFPLAKSIPVKKGWVVALTVPTWAPALAVGLGADTSWRASRGKGTCEDTSTNTVQTQPNQLAQYYCLYKTARLAYSATLVTAARARGAAPRPHPRRRHSAYGASRSIRQPSPSRS